MEPDASAVPATLLWLGRVFSVLVIAFLVLDAVM